MIKHRILLKTIRIDDIDIMKKLFNEKKISEFYDIPKSKNDLEKFCSPDGIKIIKKIIVLKETKTIIWVISIGNISRKNKRCDIWYFLWEKYEWIGLMKESLLLMIQKLFKNNGFNKIQAWIRIDNIGSVKLIEKLWFKREWTIRNFKKINNVYFDFYIYGLLKKDWKV